MTKLRVRVTDAAGKQSYSLLEKQKESFYVFLASHAPKKTVDVGYVNTVAQLEEAIAGFAACGAKKVVAYFGKNVMTSDDGKVVFDIEISIKPRL